MSEIVRFFCAGHSRKRSVVFVTGAAWTAAAAPRLPPRCLEIDRQRFVFARRC